MSRPATTADAVREVQYEACSFAIDVLECPRCGGAMKILAAIHSPETTAAILACLGLPSRAPPTEPAIKGTDPTDPWATDW